MSDMKNKVYRLDELCDIKSGKRIPKEMDFVTFETEHPYIRARDIKEGKINTDDLIYLEDDVFQKIKRYIINSGDIAITIVGASVGDIGYASKNVDGYNLTENAVRLTNYKNNVDSKFLHYVLVQKQYHDYMQLIAGAAAQPKLGIYKVNRIKVELPDLKKQKRIADILSTYDNLIEINNKRIRLLEQMTENLYKEWFVRFRFPGYEDAEFDNGAPKYWEYSKLINFIDVRYGKDHKSIEEGTIPILGSGGIMRYGDRALYNGEAVLIPRKGSLNNIMYINGEFWTVDTLFYSIPKIKNIARYLYFTFKYFDMDSLNSGASIPSMTTDIIYHLKMRQPDATVLEMFDEVLKPIYEEMDILGKQNDSIKNQRDMLLPRLMSGKLEV